MFRRFGKNPRGIRLEKIEKTANYKNGEFQNIQPTKVTPENVSMLKMLGKFINKPSTVKPSREIPNIKTDLSGINSTHPAIVWFGHSSYFLKIGDFNILVDPVFSGNASPFKFFGKAFNGANNYAVEDMPKIDILVLTHDHYDHLDYKTLKAIKPKIEKIVTSLGVGSHLEYWGYDPAMITELNWWEATKINGFKLTATPARHFSGRDFKRFKTLWSSFVLEFEDYRIYLGGDSGYSETFKELGEKFEKFDLAILECGQYNENWRDIHMMPEETVKAAKDLNAEVLMPVHWAKFVLSLHPWNDSIKRVATAAPKQNQRYVSPKIGEVYEIGGDFQQEIWWED